MSQEQRDAANEAGELAAARAKELQERDVRLASNDPVTVADLDRARDALIEAQERAAAAHRRTAERHREAATRHEQVADILEAGGHHAKAVEHRQAAASNQDAATRADRDAENDEQ